MSNELYRQAECAVQEAQALSDAAAEATGRRIDLETERPIQKDAAVRRVMAATPPTEKATYTGAERTVEAEPVYAAFLKNYRTAVVDEEKAKGRAKAALLRAQLLIAGVSRDEVAA